MINVYRTETTIWWGSYYCLVAAETTEQATKLMKDKKLDNMYKPFKWEKVDIKHNYKYPQIIGEYYD